MHSERHGNPAHELTEGPPALVETVTDTADARKKHTLFGFLFGRPLASDEDSHQRVGPAAGIPIFGLDALGSAAYGPEAALTILIPLGAAGLGYALPITLTIILLLAVVYMSYRQTIEAYPAGAGSYTVARRNLGANVGLLAGAALMLDYLMNVAVGIATGVGALVSALPSLQPHRLALCLAVLAIITFVNLRGARETGVAFMAPTYVFVACLLGTIALGVGKAILGGGHPVPVVKPPALDPAVQGATTWLLLRAFASGCTAMTGVEAVSNGVQAFKEPVVKSAQVTLTVIIAILAITLAGIGWLVGVYHVGATAPDQPGYESILSQLIGAVAGKGVFYYVAIGSILTVLSLSANTSFADFPRLCRAIAQNGYLPYEFASRGPRLVYSYGVYSLAVLSATLLIVFGGVTDRLIPLFAIGAFLSFTLSQAGMVAHWRKQAGARVTGRTILNAVGALATGVTVVIVALAKFTEGAWITLLLIPAVMTLMIAIRRHYHRVAREVSSASPIDVNDFRPPVVVVPIEEWNNVAKKALRFAMTLSDEIRALHVDCGDETDLLEKQWRALVAEPAREAGRRAPELVVVKSPYRFVVGPIVRYVADLEREHPDRRFAVVISELVERRWYHYLLHNQRAHVLTALLMFGGQRRTAVVNVPWFLEA